MKVSGSTRCSKWTSSNDAQQRLYYHGGKRVDYNELSDNEKKLVKEEKKKISKDLFKKLINEETPQIIDNGEKITIKYTSRGLDHFANDAMLTLSGKYFSKKSMMRVNKILEKSAYIPTSHELSHSRDDGRKLWFKYMDGDGRGVYFGVCWAAQLKIYELYSVKDKIET